MEKKLIENYFFDFLTSQCPLKIIHRPEGIQKKVKKLKKTQKNERMSVKLCNFLNFEKKNQETGSPKKSTPLFFYFSGKNSEMETKFQV